MGKYSVIKRNIRLQFFNFIFSHSFGYNCFGQVGVGHCDDALSPLKVKFKGKETKIVSAAAGLFIFLSFYYVMLIQGHNNFFDFLGMLHSVAVTTEGHVRTYTPFLLSL